MRILPVVLFVFICILFSVQTARAQAPHCQPIFGGGQSCIQEGDLTLDKKIRGASGNQFVDGTNVNDPKFSPNQSVTFQITIKNTGNRAIEDITVKDILPQYTTFVKGPGQFDKNTNTLTFSLDRLEAGQSRTVTIEGKIAQANAIPGATGIACVVNQATATQGRNKAGDNTPFCLQKTASPTEGQTQTPQMTPIPTTSLPIYQAPDQETSPQTGPELLTIIGLLPAGAAGLYLRKKATR